MQFHALEESQDVFPGEYFSSVIEIAPDTILRLVNFELSSSLYNPLSSCLMKTCTKQYFPNP